MATNLTQIDEKAGNIVTGTGKPLNYCGAILHPKNLQCRPDFQGFQTQNIAYSSKFFLSFHNDPKDFILSKMKFVSPLYVKPLFIDLELNGLVTVMKNVFEICYINALKLHSLLTSMYFIQKKPLPPKPWLRIVILKMASKVKQAFAKVTLKHKLNDEENNFKVQCGNFWIFLQPRFYVKSILAGFES